MKHGAHTRPSSRNAIAKNAYLLGLGIAGFSVAVLGLYAIYTSLFDLFAGPAKPAIGLAVVTGATMAAGLALSGVGYVMDQRGRRIAASDEHKDRNPRRAKAA